MPVATIPASRRATLRISRPRTTAEKVLWVLLALAFVRGLLYAMLNPPFSSPDEIDHFHYVVFMAMGATGDRGGEGHQPALYYGLMAPAYWLTQGHSSAVQLLAIRLANIPFLLGTVVLTWLAARRIAPSRSFVPIAATAFVALQPELGFVGASANNDNAANFAAALLTYLVVSLLTGNAGRLVLAATVLSIPISVMTKGQVLPVTVVSLLVLIVYVAQWTATAKSKKPFLYLGLGGLVALLLLGTRDGTALFTRAATMLSVVVLWQESIQTAQSHGLDPFFYQFFTFWSAFLGEVARPPAQSYIAPAAVVAVAPIGYVALVIRRMRAGLPIPRKSVLSRLALVAMIAGVWMLDYLVFLRVNNPSYHAVFWSLPTISGRYLFTALVPLALLVAEGWSFLIQERHQRIVALGLVTLFALFDMLSISVLINGQRWPLAG